MTNIMGHRGASAAEPENTLRSFRRALAMGVAAVELDVQLTRDGRLAVIHDETLDRTTNGRGPVKDFTMAELQRLDAGRGEPVPSLEDVFDLVKGQAHLVVEMKDPESVPALLGFFRQHQAFEFARVISFWHPGVKILKEQEPRLVTGVLMVGCPVDPVALARTALADSLILQYRYVTPELVAAAHAHGLQVFVWNIDDPDRLKPYLAMNLDGIGSNCPDVLIEYLKRLETESSA
ncbi:MAG TPA: glycerophosphodiester phosphodiesterase family protein [Desulfobaccales bacterium]|nr:glycerophosphodiester phosphodiesterase family protein [Desulfobaccales bacterium]